MLKLEFHQERVGDKRGTWNNVLLFGHKVAEQSWGIKIPSEGKLSWGGEYWTIQVKNVRLSLYNPVSVLKSTFKPLVQDLKYAVKVFSCVRSGYYWLEYHTRDEWEPIGYTMYPDFSLDDQPYYVCARFGNRRHIPLPLVLGDDGDAGPLQRLAIRSARRFSKAMRKAEYDCAYYENQFKDVYPDVA
jgi:hypothetical protein